MVDPVVGRLPIRAHEEAVDEVGGVRHHPLDDWPPRINFLPDPCLQAEFHCPHLCLQLSDCSLCVSVRLRVVRWRVLTQRVVVPALGYSFLYCNQRGLSICLQDHFSVSELVHGLGELLDYGIVSQAFALDQVRKGES